MSDFLSVIGGPVAEALPPRHALGPGPESLFPGRAFLHLVVAG
ncbi:hypothetical protein [Streptomyces californicus]